MAASAIPRLTRASNLAVCDIEKWWCAASEVTTGSQWSGGFPACQNFVKRVWSAVRPEFVELPMLFTSSKSAVYWSLVMATGPAVRNCEGERMTQGVVVANCGSSPGAMAGGVGRHWPG